MHRSTTLLATRSPDPVRRCFVALYLAAVACGTAEPAQGRNARNELPIPTSPTDDLTTIQRTFKPAPPPTLTLFPAPRDDMRDLPAFIRDSKVDLHVRSYYRDVVTNTAKRTSVEEAWAGGGSLSLQTSRLVGVLSGGAVLHTSLPLYAPPQYGGTASPTRPV